MKFFIQSALLVFLLLWQQANVWAQGCSMCTKTASQLGDDAAKGLNAGILYLAFLPLGIMVTIFILWRKGSFKF